MEMNALKVAEDINAEYWSVSSKSGTFPCTLEFCNLIVNHFVLIVHQKQESRIGSTSGALIRVLTSHQCASGSNPGPSVICGLSLLVVLVLGSGVFLRKLLLCLPLKLTLQFWNLFATKIFEHATKLL